MAFNHYSYHQSGEESIYDEWGFHNTADVCVDFLLPTGVYIPLDVPRRATIREVKKVSVVSLHKAI